MAAGLGRQEIAALQATDEELAKIRDELSADGCCIYKYFHSSCESNAFRGNKWVFIAQHSLCYGKPHRTRYTWVNDIESEFAVNAFSLFDIPKKLVKSSLRAVSEKSWCGVGDDPTEALEDLVTKRWWAKYKRKAK